MKKFVAIDCDGVLTNGFLEKTILIGNELSGKNLTTVDIKKDILGYYPDHRDQIEQEFIMAPGFVNSFDPYPQAQEFVEWLRKNDYAFKFVTSVYHDHPTWQFERQLWLQRHYGATRLDTVFCKDKSFVPSTTLIDDLDHNAVDWMKAQQATSILFKTPQNESVVEKFDLVVAEEFSYSTVLTQRSTGKWTEEAILYTNDWGDIKNHVEFIMEH